MSILGYGQGGQAGLGPSKMFDSLPYKNWRDRSDWLEEFIDSIGLEWDIRNARFVSAAARAALLDPTHDSTTDVSDPNMATPTTAPTNAASQDTMLDVLLYIALGIYPADTNLTIAQKQALVQVGWTALRHKANRVHLLNLVSKVTGGVVYGWSNPPNTFSIIVPDGLPSPGYGSWVGGFTAARTGTVAVTNGSAAVVGTGTLFTTETFVGDRFSTDKTTTYVVTAIADDLHLTLHATYAGSTTSGLSYYGSASDPFRPWILPTIRNLVTPLYPSWADLGVGYSQFRAGHSAAGETVFPSGARINILKDEHFSSWTAGVPDNWSKAGAGTLSQSSTDSKINREFTNYAAVLDLTAAANGTGISFSQTAAAINNQLTHRVELDYAYTSTTGNAVLTMQITDSNADGNTYYWNPSTSAWSTSAYSIPLPPASSRTRYACDVIPQSDSATATAFGTATVSVLVVVASDGTANTQLAYTLYRCGLYEKFSLAAEQAAIGERTLWTPLIDAAGWTTMSRVGGGATIVVPQNAARTTLKAFGATKTDFPYHPALTSRGYRSTSTWTNIIKGSVNLVTDWTLTNCAGATASVISPLVGETSATATKLTASGAGATSAAQTTGSTPTNKTYCGGVWVKLVAGSPTACTLSMSSTNTTASVSFTPTSSWQLVPIGNAAFGAGDVAALVFKVAFTAASGTDAIACYSAYAYDVTGKAGVLYPPVVQTAVGATGSVAATKCQALTNTPNTDTLHPLLLRQLCSVVNGAMQLTVVPTFDWSSQPNGVIWDIAKDATHDRVKLEIASGVLKLSRWDDAAHTGSVSLTLSGTATPAAGSMTWRRDTAIIIRARWSSDGSMSLSANDGNVTGGAISSFAAVDGSCIAVGIGNDYALANPFDGFVTLNEEIQIGAPVA